jgi:hypothetical protein
VAEGFHAFLLAIGIAIVAATAVIATYGLPRNQEITSMNTATMKVTAPDKATTEAQATTNQNVGGDDQQRLDFWNRLYLAGAAGAAAFGALGLIASLFMYYYSGRVSREQNAVIRELRTASDVAKGEVARAQLEIARITHPRMITPEQATKLKELLANAPKGTVTISAGLLDFESKAYADQIRVVLKEIGYNVVAPPVIKQALSIGDVGISLVLKQVQGPHPVAAALQRGLMEALGIQVRPYVDESLKPDEVWITIGPKF